MKKIVIFIVMFLLGFVITYNVNCQDIPSSDTAKKIRQLEAERDFYKTSDASKDELIESIRASRDGWQKLAENEKKRADLTRQAEIDAIAKERDRWRGAFENERKANIELKKSNTLYETQSKRDAEYILKLEGRVKNLKRQRWVFGAVGFGLGTYGGAKVRF